MARRKDGGRVAPRGGDGAGRSGRREWDWVTWLQWTGGDTPYDAWAWWKYLKLPVGHARRTVAAALRRLTRR